MNDVNDEILLNKLQGLYQSGDSYKKLFEWMSNRQRSRAVTTIDQLAKEIGVSVEDARAIAKQLGNVGCGIYKEGRRGHKTRVVWRYNIISLGNAAMGSSSSLRPAEDDEDVDLESTDLIEREFPLRPNVSAKMLLPRDITDKEADRLANFIKLLPMN